MIFIQTNNLVEKLYLDISSTNIKCYKYVLIKILVYTEGYNENRLNMEGFFYIQREVDFYYKGSLTR